MALLVVLTWSKNDEERAVCDVCVQTHYRVRKFAVKLRSIQAQAMKANLRDGAVVNPEPTTRDGFQVIWAHSALQVASDESNTILRQLHPPGAHVAQGCLQRKKLNPRRTAEFVM